MTQRDPRMDDFLMTPGGELVPRPVTFTPGIRDNGRVTWFSCAVCGATVLHDPDLDDESMLELHAEWHATTATSPFRSSAQEENDAA